MNYKKNLPIYYLIGFAIFWAILAIDPNYRLMWVIENAIMFVFLAVLIISYRWFKFSNTSYTLILMFLMLQTIGAHYTYAEVPFDFVTNLFNFERNNYDRFVHLSFGLLLAYPFREFVIRTSEIRSRFWTYYFPVEWAFAMGAVYEVVEFLFAIIADPNATDAFLGSQGDIWDAQKDVLLAGVGAIIAMSITFIIESCKNCKKDKKNKTKK